MKNREKYKNELMDVVKVDGRICGFMKKHGVYRMFGKDWESFCGMDCVACGMALQIWLDEEYEEPEVDWENVPVDTLVRVRYDKSDNWLLRYFSVYELGAVAPYVTWANGSTSVTSGGIEEHWKYCELVEDEDNGCN